MFSRIGIVIFCLGLTMADSECLLIPLAFIATGMLLVKIGMDRGEFEDKQEEREEQ